VKVVQVQKIVGYGEHEVFGVDADGTMVLLDDEM
jgi:hypothetical protein